MRILTWNCNGALRKKLDCLTSFQADIYIIQECEDPSISKDSRYREWANNHIWVGENKHKGLGIFAKENIRLNKLDWVNEGLQYFIPCRVNDNFNLLGTWCHGANFLNFNYIGQLWQYLQLHRTKLGKSIIAGDFNSNAIWDRKSRYWNHSDVVRELKELKIESFYHLYFQEEQGKESSPTFFFQKNLSKPYHIDFIFASNEFFETVDSFKIGEATEWLAYSDHMPIICEFG